MPTAHSILTTTHGRYLVEAPSYGRPIGLLVGFHGYAEPAEAQLERLRSIPGAEGWLIVSVQGLHRFYNRRSEEVVASWMTSQDRELAIADNLEYVGAVVAQVARDVPSQMPLVFTGFSQGVAMAFRAGCRSAHAVAGIVAAGGDVPPELDSDALARIPAAFVARGTDDELYSAAKWAADQTRLRAAAVNVQMVGFAGGHEWTNEVSAAAGAFLRRLTLSSD